MPNPPFQPRLLAKAFTFAEIMFAVVILGIGFIMLAGMFPVAIQETRSTQSESYSNPMIQNAVGILTQQANSNAHNPVLIRQSTTPVKFPYDEIFSPALYSNIDDSLGTLPSWKPNYDTNNKPIGGSGIEGNLISTTDARYAWTPLYRYRKGDNLLEVTLFACEAFDLGAGFTKPNPSKPTQRILDPSLLIPRSVAVTYKNNTVTLNDNSLPPGSYLVIGIKGFPTQIVRLANEIFPGEFELYPNCGTLPPGFPSKSVGWVIAKTQSVTDISVVTTCIPVAPWTPPY